MTEQPPKSCDDGKGSAQRSILPKEDDIVENIEETSSRKVEESDKQPCKNFVKEDVHTLPFELNHSDENEEEEEGSEEGEIVEKGAAKRKREEEAEEDMKSVKRARMKALWEGFGEEGEFSLRSGRLYDSKEWIGKDW